MRWAACFKASVLCVVPAFYSFLPDAGICLSGGLTVARYGLSELSLYESKDAHYEATLREIYSILAYVNPKESPAVAYLFDKHRRVQLATTVNELILSMFFY